jgi:hypothetical protein
MCTSSKTGRDIDPLHLAFYLEDSALRHTARIYPKRLICAAACFPEATDYRLPFQLPTKEHHSPSRRLCSWSIPEQSSRGYRSVDANKINPDKRKQQVRLPADPQAREDNAVTIFGAYKLNLFSRMLLRHKPKHSLKNKCPWALCISIYPQ